MELLAELKVPFAGSAENKEMLTVGVYVANVGRNLSFYGVDVNNDRGLGWMVGI